MNKQASGLIAAVFAALFIGLTNDAYGCSCRPLSPCAAYGDSKAVFVGRMIGGTEKNTKIFNGRSVDYEAGNVRFEVEEIFKGVAGKEITIFLETEKKTSCEWPGYQPGERYLIFAREYKGRLVIGPCNPSKRFLPPRPDRVEDKSFPRKYWDAETGLKFLRGLPANAAGGRLNVVVQMINTDGERVPGIPIAVTSQDKTSYEAITDENGESVFDNLKPEKYSITADWPKGYDSGFPQPEIEIGAQSCSEVEALVIYSGLITGKITDEHNQPAQSVRVYALLLKPQDGEGNRWAETKEDGKFQIGGLAAGSYLLYIESASKGVPNYFYPGVSDPAQAIEIVIGKGDVREGLDFKLPPTIETQTIRGKVVWPDGKPVAEGTIYLSCPEPLAWRESKIEVPTPTTKTDADGNFTIQGFKGFSYSLKANVHTGDPNVYSSKNHAHAPLVRLSLADEVIEVRLVLSGTGYGPDCNEEKRQKDRN